MIHRLGVPRTSGIKWLSALTSSDGLCSAMKTEVNVIFAIQQMIEADEIGKLDVACRALLSSAEASLILANNQGSLQFHQGYNALNFGIHVLSALALFGVTFQGKAISATSATLGPATFEYASRATKVQLKNFGIDSSAGVMNLLYVVSNSMASKRVDSSSAIAKSMGLPQGPMVWGGHPYSLPCARWRQCWHTSIGSFPKPVPDKSTHLWSVSASHGARGQRANHPLQWKMSQDDLWQFRKCWRQWEVTDMTDPKASPLDSTGKSTKASHTQYDAAVALMKAGLIQKLFWQQTPDLCDALVVVWSAMLPGIHIKFYSFIS